jgi:hypothetical protein
MRGWQGQPRKMVECEHWQKKTSQNVDRRAMVVLKMTCSQSGCKVNTLFSAARTSNSMCLRSGLV